MPRTIRRVKVFSMLAFLAGTLALGGSLVGCEPVQGPVDVGTQIDGVLGFSAPEEAEAPSRIRVVTANIFCPTPGGCSRAKIESIGEALKGADVILLQEAFWDDLYAQVGKAAGLAYSTRGPKKQGSALTSGGTAILSRFPFDTAPQGEAFEACFSSDCVTSKGFWLGRLRIGGGKRLTVGTTHFNTFSDGKGASTQVAQATQLTRFVGNYFEQLRLQGRDADPAVFGGDFNFSQNRPFPNSEAMQTMQKVLTDELGLNPSSTLDAIDHLWVKLPENAAAKILQTGTIAIQSDHDARFVDINLE